MRIKLNMLSTAITLGACATLLLSAVAQAQDKKADLVGTWTWTAPARGGGGGGGAQRTNTLTFKKEGDKLVGTLSAPGRGGQPTELKVEDAKLVGEDVTFSTTRETQSGAKIVSKYAGKISGDTIKGKVDIDRDGEVQSRDWEAKRQAAEKK